MTESESGRSRSSLSRRDFISAAAGAGLAAALTSSGWLDGYAFAAGVPPLGTSTLGTGTVPEQIHLTWGADASRSMTVSWLAPSPQDEPQVLLSPATEARHVFPAIYYTYTDRLSGEAVHAYHVTFEHLEPGTKYTYTVRDGVTPAVSFTSTFTTANRGRFPFAFTSFGDLGTPGAGANYTLADGSVIASDTYSESQWNAYTAVGQVEAMAPLFHLVNGDLSYADKATISATGQTTSGSAGVQTAPEVWRDFGLNTQRSAANRPWMPCIGNHEAELVNGPYGYAAYNTRYKLPDNGTPQFDGNFYSFRVGSVLFIALDANDVCYQGAGAYNVGGATTTDSQGYTITSTEARYNQFYTGTFTPNADGTWAPGGTTPNQQTVWLQQTLQNARNDKSLDWIVVQMHQSAMSNSSDNGCDAAIRQAWLPLFAKYQVDLVVNGHDHDYSRTYPVNGFIANQGTSSFTTSTVTQATPGGGFLTNATSGAVTVPTPTGMVNTFTPKVAQSGTGPFNTTQGTVFMVIGGGGTNKRDNTYVAVNASGVPQANVTTFTQVRTGSTKPVPDCVEPAAWAAQIGTTTPPVYGDTTDAYGIALFQVDPGPQAGANTTITVSYYHAPTQTSGTPNYTVLDTFQLVRPRSD